MPVTIPIPCRPRDYQREAPTGNSNAYLFRRLDRNRPDLLALVKEGKLSPNRAAIEAGFREPAITIPRDPVKAGRRLALHFSATELNTLLEAALDALSVRGPVHGNDCD